MSVAGSQTEPSKRPLPLRKNEWKLAGLLPGRTTAKRAQEILGGASSDGTMLRWSGCDGLFLEAQTDRQGTLQTIRLAKGAAPDFTGGCSRVLERTRHTETGLGLRIGDASAKVLAIYGKPDSRSPSTKDGQPLELLYYAFDWAGPDVPQVMQVVCTTEKDGQAGRVVQITLAASSL